MKTLRRTSIIINPDTAKPVTTTIITKKGNKKTIVQKSYNLTMVPLSKQEKRNPTNPYTGRNKFNTLNKFIPTIVHPKKDDIWSEIGKQTLKEYRSIKAKLDFDLTKVYTHNDYDRHDPNSFGYYEVAYKEKPKFAPLPKIKLTAEERKAAMSAHKSLMDLRRAEKKAQRTDLTTLELNTLSVFNKESYTAQLKERIAKRLQPTKRFDGLTMSFRNHIAKVKDDGIPNRIKESYGNNPFLLTQYKKLVLPSGHERDEKIMNDFAANISEAVEKAHKWKTNNNNYKVVVYYNPFKYVDPPKIAYEIGYDQVLPLAS